MIEIRENYYNKTYLKNGINLVDTTTKYPFYELHIDKNYFASDKVEATKLIIEDLRRQADKLENSLKSSKRKVLKR